MEEPTPTEGTMTILLRRIGRALALLGPDLMQRACSDDWDEAQAVEVARAVVACLQAKQVPATPSAPGRGAQLPHDALKQAVRFVNDNLDSTLRWSDIAAAVGMDPFRFGRGFKLATGMTPHQYVVRCRVARAMELLANTKWRIADIAFEVGCSCQSHLTTMFRRRVGTTPKAFRRAAIGRAQRARAVEARPTNVVRPEGGSASAATPSHG